MRTHAHAHTPVPKVNTAFEQTPLHLQATSAAHKVASSGSGGSILRTIIALAIVIAVIYGLTWIVRKIKGRDLPAAGEGMERIASLPLGTNKSVALVRVGAELHLLGVSEHTVTGIRSFSEDEAVELGLPVTPPGSGPSRSATAAEGHLGGLTRTVGNIARRRSTTGTLDSLRRMTQR